MDHSALNALWERAEVFNKMEETVSLLNEEEAKILTTYAESLLKTRPLRSIRIPTALSAPYGPTSRPESEQPDTNCELCAAGKPRLKDAWGFYHEIGRDIYGPIPSDCEAAHA